MTWTVIDDKKILTTLRHNERTCVRMVMLNTVGSGPSIEDFLTHNIDAPFDCKYEIHAYDTTPATAVVYEKNTNDPMGAFVWNGDGGVIMTARDHRMRLLADNLDAYFHDSEVPDASEFEGDCTCGCCGDKYNPTIGEDTHVAEFDLGHGVRSESQSMSISELLVVVGRYATEKQLNKFHELLSLGCHPDGIINIRELGGEAIGNIRIMISGLNGESYAVDHFGNMHADF